MTLSHKVNHENSRDETGPWFFNNRISQHCLAETAATKHPIDKSVKLRTNAQLVAYLEKIKDCPKCRENKVAQGSVTLQYLAWDESEKADTQRSTDVCKEHWALLAEKPIEWSNQKC